MYMTDHQKLAEARALSVELDRLTRNHRKVSPSAPWIIPAMLIFVGLFAIICIVIKLFMNYINRKQAGIAGTKTFALSEASSPDIPTTPEQDQASMATTASMKTRGSLRQSSKHKRKQPPPVSLYQIKQMQSPGSSSSRSKHKHAMRAISRAAKAEANRGISRDSSRQTNNDGSDDNMPNDGDNSPIDLSQRSVDMEEVQPGASQSGVAFIPGFASRANYSEPDGAAPSSQNVAEQPEVHIVQIRDIDDTQLTQPNWPQAESEI